MAGKILSQVHAHILEHYMRTNLGYIHEMPGHLGILHHYHHQGQIKKTTNLDLKMGEDFSNLEIMRMIEIFRAAERMCTNIG